MNRVISVGDGPGCADNAPRYRFPEGVPELKADHRGAKDGSLWDVWIGWVCSSNLTPPDGVQWQLSCGKRLCLLARGAHSDRAQEDGLIWVAYQLEVW